MKLSLVMPAYNEEKSLAEIVRKVEHSLKNIDYELIIIDDNSKDKTVEIAKGLCKRNRRISLIQKEKNSGKSQSVKLGILKSKGDYVVIQDSDLEYDPEDVVKLFNCITKNKLDVVYGNRFGYSNKVIYVQNWIGNSVLSLISAIFTGLRCGMWPRDMEVGYKMAKGDIYRTLAKEIISTTNFGFEPEITAMFSKVKGVKFAQLPIHYYPRTIEQGKKMNAFKHGIEALKEIIYFNLIK